MSLLTNWIWIHCIKNKIVGNKKKKTISKRRKREYKACQIFQKNKHFLSSNTHTYVPVSEGKKCSLLRKLDVLRILVTSVLKFTLLSHYRQSFPLRISLVNVSKTAAVLFTFTKEILSRKPRLLYSDPYSSVFNPLKEYNDQKFCHIWVCSTQEKCIKKYFRYLLFTFRYWSTLSKARFLWLVWARKIWPLCL